MKGLYRANKSHQNLYKPLRVNESYANLAPNVPFLKAWIGLSSLALAGRWYFKVKRCLRIQNDTMFSIKYVLFSVALKSFDVTKEGWQQPGRHWSSGDFMPVVSNHSSLYLGATQRVVFPRFLVTENRMCPEEGDCWNTADRACTLSTKTIIQILLLEWL